jgi:spore coat protein U-like protein
MIGRRVWTMTLLCILAAGAQAADVFRFYAPPGGVYANVAFEREAVVPVTLTIEHDGAGISSWFVSIDAGAGGVYEPRSMTAGGASLEYQLYAETPPSTTVIKAPPEALTVDNVLTGSEFASAVATPETGTVTFHLHIPAAQFQTAGEYTDTVTVELYTGDYATPATHVLADNVSVTLTGRNAELLDIYADQEPGIQFMDLTTTVTDRLIATVHERSNASTGYTVSLTSATLAADTSGATAPFFAHTTAGGSLEYSLTYGGAVVGGWSGGSALVTDSAATTAPQWLTKELRISYSGSAALPAGDYEDVLTVTVSAK